MDYFNNYYVIGLQDDLEEKYDVLSISRINKREFDLEMDKVKKDVPNPQYIDHFIFREIQYTDWLQWVAGEMSLEYDIRRIYRELMKEEEIKQYENYESDMHQMRESQY